MEKFTPIAMKCNQEQFEAIKPKLKGKDTTIWSFSRYPYLCNNFDDKKMITNISKGNETFNNYKVYETWNEETFLSACGIEVDTFTITKEQILQLNSFNNYDLGVALKEWFPSVFETKLEVGKWYKNTKHDYIFCFNGIYDDFSQYGVNKLGVWSVELSSHERHIAFFTPATPEEVETALVNEAKKRGFKEGVYYCFGGKKIEAKGEIRFNHQGKYNDLYFERSERFIFKDGKWAEILPQPIKMTVAEVEAKLGHAVEIVK
jgi:hypothetical protein